MNTETYIVVKNCSKEDLKTMLNDWLVMYAAHLRSKMTFEIAETAPNSFALKVDDGIDDTRFFFMVNYFSFPLNFKKTFEVEGYTTATKHKKLLGKNIYVFINGRDKEYDNVWITTEEGETYKFDFRGKLKKMNVENNYKIWNAAGLPITFEQIHVDKKALLAEAARLEDEKSRRSTAKRFKIISALLFVLIPLTYLINRLFLYTENDLLDYLSTIVITTWFLDDYKIFHTPKRTFICVLLSLLNITFASMPTDSINTVLTTLPLSLVIVMLAANKCLGARIGKIQDSRGEGLFLFVRLVASGLISFYVFSPVLEYLKVI